MKPMKLILALSIAFSMMVLSGCSDDKLAEANHNLLSALILNGISGEVNYCIKDGSSPCDGKLSTIITAITSETGMDSADAENYLAETINTLSKHNTDSDKIKSFIEDRKFIVEMAKVDYQSLQNNNRQSSNIWE